MWRHIEINSLDWWEHKGSGHVITKEELSSEGNFAGECVVHCWIHCWASSVEGSWIACVGVIPSVGMINLSPQSNGCSIDARTGKVRGIPAYSRLESWRVSDEILEEDVMGGEGGTLRFGVIPKS